MAAIPRGKSPSTFDIETGQKVLVPKLESKPIEVVVDSPKPTPKPLVKPQGIEVLYNAIKPGNYPLRAGKKKTRKQKRHARKTKKHPRKK